MCGCVGCWNVRILRCGGVESVVWCGVVWWTEGVGLGFSNIAASSLGDGKEEGMPGTASVVGTNIGLQSFPH